MKPVCRIVLLWVAADSFNLTNHRNPSAYVGVVTSPLFRQPDPGYDGRESNFPSACIFDCRMNT